MHVVVPFDGREPKTRLSPVLDIEERREFARAMLEDVASTIESVGFEPTILATSDVDCEWPVVVDERTLDAAVNDRLAEIDGPVAIVMADLALATPDALGRLFAAGGDVVLAPGRGGGTNAIVARHPDFRVDYHDASITDHREIAHDIGAEMAEVDSFRLASDVDDPADLAEVLLHGEGRAAAWLREHGFELASEAGRVSIER
ncbi:2-phospho-L-lactate guanylyltransferase protein [Halorhabdus tiamatea SARL4B]|uniref:2-phospho-L-lactate guanylyltransferase n=1 Tax=Halorhabdus tiamatea SARL4B TaxID=1033806 RepID=F7PIV2_9EURY|nr:2-phospho-L-lactate guanylyltransferase [Halorhabdus tiamatea]ERJ05443.1 2-phospho-L-lactate guanylyltransferase protein [Halorhabdus tiamatea SARL4B]CCQ33331.1 phospholactate guanylyltransferase [Halorhabdus tiamatea SARL4B]